MVEAPGYPQRLELLFVSDYGGAPGKGRAFQFRGIILVPPVSSWGESGQSSQEKESTIYK